MNSIQLFFTYLICGSYSIREEHCNIDQAIKEYVHIWELDKNYKL